MLGSSLVPKLGIVGSEIMTSFMKTCWRKDSILHPDPSKHDVDSSNSLFDIGKVRGEPGGGVGRGA
jgi:hypothetical protein